MARALRPTRPSSSLAASHGPPPLLAWAGTPQYARLRAMVLRGQARELAFRTYPGARKAVLFAEAPAAKRNDRGSITVGADFFAGALKDYENWRVKWWREAIQNGVDAGASHIECGVVEQADGTWRVWCQDDGKGMSRETLLDKFLVLGASGKRDDVNAKGGFGKAKEMLLLPWIGWTVTSGRTRVAGAGIDYEVHDQLPPAVGTRLEVVMPADNHTGAGHAEEFIARCLVKRVAFRVVSQNRYTNGETVVTETTASMKPGKLAVEMDGKAKVFHDPKGPSMYLVRTGGLYMFDLYMPDGVKGTLLVELTGRSIDLLTANRDSIRDSELRSALYRFTNALAADTKSALTKKGLSRKVYKGTGRFAVPARQAEAALTVAATGALEKATPLPQGGGFRFSSKSILEIAETLLGGTEAVVDEGTMAVGGASAAIASAVLASLPVKGPDHVEAVLKQLAWQPDFLLFNDREGWKPPRSLTPEHMSKKALAIAKLWAELVRYVLMRLGSREEYGIGWCFGEYGAMYATEQGQHWLLFNPLGDFGQKPDELPDPASDRLLQYLFAAAIHEATHMADGIDLHNERFASTFTQNVARCADGWATALRIREAVLHGADIALRRAMVDPTVAAPLPAAPGRRERALPPRERVVEKTVYVDRPVDRWHPAPPPVPWYEQAIASAGVPATLSLKPRAPKPSRSQQPQLGLKFNDRRAARRR